MTATFIFQPWLMSFDHTVFQLPVILWLYWQLSQAGLAGFGMIIHHMEEINAHIQPA